MREALCVELHKPNVRIFPGDSEDSGLVGWTDFPDEATEKFMLPGEEVQALCEHLGLATERRWPKGKKYSIDLEDSEFVVLNKTPYYANTAGKKPFQFLWIS